MLHQLTLGSLKGVGKKLEEKLNKLGVFWVQDLLFHLPFRYENKTELTAFESIVEGQDSLLDLTILSRKMVPSSNPHLLVTAQFDDGNLLTCRFFHVYKNMQAQFQTGKCMRVYGEVRFGQQSLEMMHPTYQLFNPNCPPALETSLTPLYRTTEGLGQASLLKLVKQAIELLNENPLKEALPIEFVKKWQLPGVTESLLTLHQPSSDDDLNSILAFEHPCQKRLIVEELLSHQLSLQTMRLTKKKFDAPSLPSSQICNALITSLPFKLTHAQIRVWEEMMVDLKQPHPMQRMLQGDVGSGKTIVAALVSIQAAQAGFQVAIMAPTEILAEQHFLAFSEWLEPLDFTVVSLKSKMKVAQKRDSLSKIESGKAQIVIGTHALFQKSIIFYKLGLVIIDEQHRFGVHQRLALQEKSPKGLKPHQLIMTATPIPRTLAMSAYGDLDLSVIDELPPGRIPIETAVLSNQKRDEVMEHVYQQCKQGIQAYWVCPLIEESELLDAQAAEQTLLEFEQRYSNLRVGLIHGRLKNEEKNTIMKAFKAHELDLLVATTVIEVGVNVPNASLMMIENAERLGLAQLHQLRGRVGRGTIKSHCVLIYQAPLSGTGKAKLNIMRSTTDGFKIAEEDLRIRGPGEVLGTRQTGGLEFNIADIGRDHHWIPMLQTLASEIIATKPEITSLLQSRWIGEKVQYKRA